MIFFLKDVATLQLIKLIIKGTHFLFIMMKECWLWLSFICIKVVMHEQLHILYVPLWLDRLLT